MSVETVARYLDMPVERIRKLIARRAIPFAQEGSGCRISCPHCWRCGRQLAFADVEFAPGDEEHPWVAVRQGCATDDDRTARA